MNENALDKLREAWKNTPVSTEYLDEVARKVSGNLETRRFDSLARKLAGGYYKCLAASVAVIAMSMPMYALGLPLWLCVLYGLFGVVMGVVYLLFARFISRSNFLCLPVVESLERAVRIRMFQRRILICGCALALLVLVPLMAHLYNMPDGGASFWGGVTGGIIGASIGVYKEICFFRTSRQLLNSIREYAGEE